MPILAPSLGRLSQLMVFLPLQLGCWVRWDGFSGSQLAEMCPLDLQKAAGTVPNHCLSAPEFTELSESWLWQ